MITAEEFFRNKLKELNPWQAVITMHQELITAEQGLRWAHEFKELHLQHFNKLLEENTALIAHIEDLGKEIESLKTNWMEYTQNLSRHQNE